MKVNVVDELEQQLIEKIEESIGEITKIHIPAEQGWTSTVRQLFTNESKYILKTSTEERYRIWLKTEAQVLKKLLHENIPVPKFHGFIDEEDRSHLIMSYEKGITLRKALATSATLEEQCSLITSFGEFLHHFHESSPIQSLQHDKNWLNEQLRIAEFYVGQGNTDGTKQLLEHLVLNKPTPVQQTMIHGDCTIDNVLVTDGKVHKFIDVAGMTVGDPRFDEALAIRKFTDHTEYIQSFYEGYKRYKITNEELAYFDEGLYEFF
ncbi:phosphotransferase [Pseudalkalibacillus sp. Hm43]|uniref:phosphotransferase n=1 Tax=Pseudalkalibacillus sp. Hm43 TaxID=3450742 RepID=UPI003F429AC5